MNQHVYVADFRGKNIREFLGVFTSRELAIEAVLSALKANSTLSYGERDMLNDLRGTFEWGNMQFVERGLFKTFNIHIKKIPLNQWNPF